MTTATKSITKKNIAVIAGVVALMGTFLIFLSSTSEEIEISNTTSIPEAESENPPLPVDAPRTGVPFLIAYPLAMKPTNYHEIDVNTNSWISRAIKNGETVISEQEIKDFFSIAEDRNYFFGVKSNDVTKYYEIEYREVPISMELHNIKAYRLEVVPDTFIPVDMSNNSWLKKAIENEFRWIQIDNPSATALTQLSKNENFNFKTVLENGHNGYYNIRYAGPGLNLLGEK